MIDYDRLTLGGKRTYYVSFNNTYVGTLLGNGLVSCIQAWNVSKPDVLVMHGAVTDNNATLFANGYNAVIDKYFTKWLLEARRSPGRHLDPDRRRSASSRASSRRTRASTPSSSPNDENGGADHRLPEDQGRQGQRRSRSPARTPR